MHAPVAGVLLPARARATVGTKLYMKQDHPRFHEPAVHERVAYWLESGLKQKDLKSECKAAGCRVGGNKRVLALRLALHDLPESVGASAAAASAPASKGKGAKRKRGSAAAAGKGKAQAPAKKKAKQPKEKAKKEQKQPKEKAKKEQKQKQKTKSPFDEHFDRLGAVIDREKAKGSMLIRG